MSERPRHVEGTEAAAAARVVDPDVLRNVVAQIRAVMQSSSPKLQMEVVSDLDRVVVKVFDGDSGELIRQIPAQEVLAVARELRHLEGLLFRKRA